MMKIHRQLIVETLLNTEGLIENNTTEDLVQFVIDLDNTVKKMDFSEPLYRHFKKVMEKEDPEGL